MSNDLQKLKEGAESRSVLIVDDDKELSNSLARILRTFFKECVSASDGEEAYALFSDRQKSASPFTVIITDLELPKMGGMRLIREIKAISPKQPILILSAHDEPEYMAEAIRLNINGYLLKPLAMPKLFESLEKIFTEPLDHPLPVAAEVDPVTGWKMLQELTDTVQSPKMPPITLLRMRINHLNNMFTFVGETFANEYIAELASLMQSLLNNANGEFYRTASDEFCLVLSGEAIESAKNIAAKTVSMVRYFHTSEKGIILNSTLSVGIAYGKEQVLMHSKLALEKVLDITGGGYSVFTLNAQDENAALMKSRSILHMIFNALHDENIVPFFQPICTVSPLELFAYESIVRIRKDTNLYEPESFWSLAVDMGQVGLITRSMIRHTFGLMTHLNPPKPIVLTLTAYDLNDESILNYIRFWLERYKIDPSQIIFQIAEGTKALQNPMIFDLTRQLQANGFKMIIADFGLDECNLSILLTLKPDYIKLHPDLVLKSLREPTFSPVFKGIVDVIHTMGAKAIVPAVSDVDAYESLLSIGIDYLSGPYTGEPFEVQHD